MGRKLFKLVCALLVLYIIVSSLKTILGMVIGFVLFSLPILILSLCALGVCGVIIKKIFIGRN